MLFSVSPHWVFWGWVRGCWGPRGHHGGISGTPAGWREDKIWSPTEEPCGHSAGLPQATLPPSASPQCPQLWATGLSPWPGTFHPRREGWDAPYWPTGTQVTKKLSLQTYSSSSSWGDRWVHCSIPQTWRTRYSARPWNRKEGHCPCPRPRPDSL